MKINLMDKAKNTVGKAKGMSKKKKIIFTVIAVLILIFIVLGVLKAFGGKKIEKVINTAFADKGEIELTISGTGMIEANDQYEVMALVKGEIMSAPFEEGDVVEKGDLLYSIDTTDIENSIERSKISLQRTQNTYNDTMQQLDNLTVEAPISGTITALNIKKGDDVNGNTKIAEITDTSKMVLTIPFIDEHVSQFINVGDTAYVTLQNTNDTIFGTVTRVVTGTYVNNLGVVVRNVEITVDNPGAIREGDKATAVVGEAACNDSGTFKNYGFETVYSKVSGEVSYLPFVQGDRITKGELLVRLESDSVEQNVTSSSLSLREAQLSLENTYNQLENYNITSPISGTVIEKTSKQGDTLDNSNNSVTMAVIADMSKMLFTMSIDELDITKIEVGQQVEIEADAFEDKMYTGYVEKVSAIGTSQNGVTTYPITVVVNEPDGLIPGMNVSATVIIEKKENVIRVPVSAVRRGNIVYVKGAEGKNKELQDTSENTKDKENSKMPKMGVGIPEGFTAVPVKTGINDENYIEIISGISEGDEVWVPQTATSTNAQQMPSMSGMPGGMGGGMPGGMSGGMPSGMSGGMRR